jgi:hypothetical protein
VEKGVGVVEEEGVVVGVAVSCGVGENDEDGVIVGELVGVLVDV